MVEIEPSHKLLQSSECLEIHKKELRSLSQCFLSELAEEIEEDICSHPFAHLPLPYGLEDEKNTDLIFLDPGIGEGKRLIADKTTTVSQLFAVMRQFVSPVCNNIGLVVDEMLQRSVNVNDVDGTTGMNMLHYAIRAVSLTDKQGIGVVKRLLCKGADPGLRSLYTDMNALHIASYFNAAPVVALLLKSCDLWPVVAIESVCGSFEYGTSLHIAAACLSCEAAEVLLQKGANSNAKDDLGRTPDQCIPQKPPSKREREKAKLMQELLCRKDQRFSAEAAVGSVDGGNRGGGKEISGKSLDRERRKSDTVCDFAAGGRVLVAGTKLGTVRFVGNTQFASGTWCGIELDGEEGKGGNDGCVAGVRYFRCGANKGIFAPPSKLQHHDTLRASSEGDRVTSRGRSGKVVAAKSDRPRSSSTTGKTLLKSDMKVNVKGITSSAIVKFVGRTDFAGGVWVGLDLGGAIGRNDGSVQGRRYFSCPPRHGIMVRPSRVSHKGISGTKLLPPGFEE